MTGPKVRNTARPADTEWRLYAACRDLGDVMFPDNHPINIAEAKRICGMCPVRDDCLTDALNREGGSNRTYRHGVYGGLTGPERYDRYRRRLRAAQKDREQEPALEDA